MTTAAAWAEHLATWAIDPGILEQAPESPFIHPPSVFALPDTMADSPSHRLAREVLQPGDSILDVGCGGGIATFAIASPGHHVIGVDHQQEMLDMYTAAAAQRGLTSETHLGDWPDIEAEVPVADVVVCHHVVYNVPRISEFMNALNSHARKRVVLELPQQHPLSGEAELWQHFWNVTRPHHPTALDLLSIAHELGFDANAEMFTVPVRPIADEQQAIEYIRIRLCLDSSRDNDIRDFLREHPLPSTRHLTTISWDV